MIESPLYVNPEACSLGRLSIAALARRTAARAGYQAGGDIEAAVAALGGKVVYQDFFNLDSSDSGSIQVEPDASFTVYVANHTSQARDRFTIAHELGHYVLHFLLPRTATLDGGAGFDRTKGLMANRFGAGLVEIEANYFAACLTMPEQAFVAKFHAVNGDLVDTAAVFGVSLSAAAVRAKALGLSDQDPA